MRRQNSVLEILCAAANTAMPIITASVPSSAGRIVVDRSHDFRRYVQKVGYVPQHTAVAATTRNAFVLTAF